MESQERILKSTDDELFIIHSAICRLVNYNGNEILGYRDRPTMDEWINMVDSELHHRKIFHKH